MNLTETNKLREKKVNIILGCLVLVFITSLPLFTDFLLNATDLQYQLVRIEALKNGLQQYGILMWAKPEWINPQGFSFAFFYGDTFLYIPAFFRLMGIDVQMSYRLFLILINGCTVLASFGVFRRMFRDAYVGLLGSALYSVSIYRIFLLYAEAELGESIALVFLPFVLLGCYRIFVEEAFKESESNVGFLHLALGLTGMLRSHILSAGIATLFVLVFALVHAWKLAQKRVWAQIGLSLVAVALMNCSYFYTILQYIRSGFVVNPVSGQAIQAKGLQIAQLFMCFYQAGGSHEFGANGVNNAVPVGVGFTLLLVILVFAYLLFVYGAEVNAEAKARGWRAFWIGAAACILSLLSFPWDYILKLSGATSSLVSMMQAPWHFLQIALLCFTALGCLTYGMVKEKNALYAKAYGVGLVLMTCLSASYLAANLLFTYDFSRIKLPEEIGYAELADMGVVAQLPSGLWYVLEVISIAAVALGIGYMLRKKRNA